MTQQFGGLEAYRQFIIYTAVPRDNGKTDKYPIDPSTFQITPKGSGGAQNPAFWLSLREAQALLQMRTLQPGEIYQGVGFVFTDDDPFFFFDLDNQFRDGAWTEIAQQMCGYFAGCFIEVSISGTGLHIIGTGNPPAHCINSPFYKFELYHSGRFCALTGTNAQGSALHNVQSQIEWLATNYFPPKAERDKSVEWTFEPCPEWDGPEDDGALIEKMLGARTSVAATFGNRASFADLWEANEDVLGQFFPPNKAGRSFDRSNADAALFQHLAFWTGKNCERMAQLYELSGLFPLSDKWGRPDYRERTILGAVSLCSTVYTGGRTADPAYEPPVPVEPLPVLGAPVQTDTPVPDPSMLREGFQFLGITQQQKHFSGCVYISDSHRIYVPDGRMLKTEQFNATYGGYVFALDLSGDKVTRKAWEVFTESQAFNFPKAHEACFRPELAPGALVHEEGFTLVNTYVPIVTRREAGDPAPFLDLLARLFPNERDRTIITSYMAAMVQYPGAKFQWWPVIQGVEGNGKSAIIRVLNHCIGNRYTHLPSPEAMAKTGNQFNGWIDNKLFVGIEEIYVPHRRDFLEAFKTTVTNDRIQIEGKGSNQRMGDNRANGIMCTNHKDGVPVTVDTRRYSIFYTAQQTKEDKARWGMTGAYFPELYQWFRGTGRWAAMGTNYGYAVVNDYLHRYAIPLEFNPAPHGMCQEAPQTSSTIEAIQVSRGPIEQEIMEAIEEGRPGFAGGWISSTALSRLLERKGISPNKQREIARSLGYEWHPALKDGRVSNPIPDPAGHGKPRLYVLAGHIALNITDGAGVARAYLKAQESSGVVAQVFSAQGVV